MNLRPYSLYCDVLCENKIRRKCYTNSTRCQLNKPWALRSCTYSRCRDRLSWRRCAVLETEYGSNCSSRSNCRTIAISHELHHNSRSRAAVVACTVKQITDNEIYLLTKYIKSVLWRVAKRLSYIQDARCLKVKRLINGCRRGSLNVWPFLNAIIPEGLWVLH